MNMRPSPIFPLPLPFHIGFIILSVVVLLLSYRQKRQLHKLMLLAGIVSTALIYWVTPGTSFYILAFEEIALFIAVVVLMIIESRNEKKQAAKGSHSKNAE